jgi:hypothetical protein
MKKYTLVISDSCVTGFVFNDAMIVTLQDSIVVNGVNPKKIKEPAQYLLDNFLQGVLDADNKTIYFDEREIDNVTVYSKTKLTVQSGDDAVIVDYRDLIERVLIDVVDTVGVFGW